MTSSLPFERKQSLNLSVQIENAKEAQDIPLLMRLMERFDKEFIDEVNYLINIQAISIDVSNDNDV